MVQKETEILYGGSMENMKNRKKFNKGKIKALLLEKFQVRFNKALRIGQQTGNQLSVSLKDVTELE